MKKKVRKYAEGGNPNITDDVRQRARMFAALADKSEQQEDFSRAVKEAQQAEAEASDRRARASSAPAAKTTPTPAAKAAPAPRAVSEPGKFTDSDEDARREAREASEAANLSRINAARNLETADITPPASASSAAPVGRAGQARASVTPSSVLREIRGGENAAINEARIEARRRAEADARQRREEADAASQAGSQRGSSIAEGRRNQEAAEAASARATVARSPGLGRSMTRSQPAKPSSAESPRAPTRRFMADRMRRRVERPSGTESFAKGGSVGSASTRGDGIAKRGKTRGRLV